MDEQREVRPSCIKSPGNSPVGYSMREAARREKNQCLEPVANEDEGQEAEVVEDLLGIDALGGLSPQDKGVQVHFDEQYTNEKARYSRTEDIPYCCGYFNLKKLRRRKYTEQSSSSVYVAS
uniref:Uncharacterized protein n=1 Tax=Glossina palpalis gambiensis TaxID=67801 RepID=A0A1B0BWQ0_9MUSC